MIRNIKNYDFDGFRLVKKKILRFSFELLSWRVDWDDCTFRLDVIAFFVNYSVV